MNLARTVILWIGRYLALLLLVLAMIIVVPPAVQFARQAVNDFEEVTKGMVTLETAKGSIRAVLADEIGRAQGNIGVLERATRRELEQRISKIDKDLQGLGDIRPLSPVEVGLDAIRGETKNIEFNSRTRLKIELLKRQRAYLEWLLDSGKLRDGKEELERRRLAHVKAYDALRVNLKSQEDLRRENPLLRVWSNAELADLEAREPALRRSNSDAEREYKDQEGRVRSDGGSSNRPVFDVPQQVVDEMSAPIRNGQRWLDERLHLNWFGSTVSKAREAVAVALPKAVWIVLGVVLVPIGIKIVFYFVLAPLATRGPAIALLPQLAGATGDSTVSVDDVLTSSSSVSRSITVDASNELLVHPEYIQTSPHGSCNDTKWLLSWRYWLASTAAGLYAITRMRSDSPVSVALTDSRDPFSEIAAVPLRQGAAMMLRPRHLIGVLQLRDQPPQISSHWRILSLHAWLTLQLRYLVFHGPATLIVKGCRGVRIEPADSGRSISQAATIGFSANLGYASHRSETFVGYLSGKQPLLHDSFSGANGYYVYQQMPRSDGKAGVTGRGLEGVIDAFLQVFGI